MLALDDSLKEPAPRARAGKVNADAPNELASHPLAIHAGAIGAALWGAYGHQKVRSNLVAWTPAVVA